MICKGRLVTKYVTILPYNPSRHSYDTTIITPSLPSQLHDWFQTEQPPNPMISKNCLQYWYSSQRKTSWIKWLEQLCRALKTYPWNWLGALIETLLIIVCTSLQKMKQSSAHHCIIQTKDLGSNYGNKFMNIHIDCLSRLVSCKLISWARSAPQKHKQVKYWYHSHISRHICMAPNC